MKGKDGLMELFQSNICTLVVGNTQVDSIVYRGAQRLINAITITNMQQAIHTRTPVSTDHFVFDSNPGSTTATKMILKVPTNSEMGVYHSKKNESCVTQANTVYPAKAKFILARIGNWIILHGVLCNSVTARTLFFGKCVKIK